MANLRLVLGGDVQPGDEHTPKHGHAGLWSLLGHCCIGSGGAGRRLCCGVMWHGALSR
jgi:hypothetical protein